MLATSEELAESLNTFCKNCNENDRLKIMNRDWNRHINVRATDNGAVFTIVYHEGLASLKPGLTEEAELTVQSDSEILTDLFFGDITPTEPYMNGTLKVVGSEEDVMRLDFISLMIWGE
ncbi:MAG: SCP2 sterol-binding domain-containing protein [Bacillota bacterium]